MSRGARVRVCEVCGVSANFSVCLHQEDHRRSLRCLEHTPAPGTNEVSEHIWIGRSEAHDENYEGSQRVRWYTSASVFGTVIGPEVDPHYYRCYTVLWDGQPGLTTIHPSVLVRVSPLEELAQAGA